MSAARTASFFGAPCAALRGAGIVACLFAVACDDKPTPPSAPQARLEAVAATGPATATATVSAAPAAAKTPAAHAVLCAHQLAKPGKDAPKSSVSRAGNQSTLPEKLTVGGGSWTWINLWAAWCVPCKEEMPRLRSWEAKTASERTPLRVEFVSMDDDGRQLENFLAAQSATGIDASYWLTDGNQRAAWLKEAGFDDQPELPGHVLVDPNGKVRCKQQGAVDDTDFGELQKILRGER
jgi:thiol-disulfide isomerase/thioredoxin